MCLFSSICTQIITQQDHGFGFKSLQLYIQLPISLKLLIWAGARWDQDLPRWKESGELVFKTSRFLARGHGLRCVWGRCRTVCSRCAEQQGRSRPAWALNGLSVYGATRLGKSFKCIFSSWNIERTVFIFRGLRKNYVSYFKNKHCFYRGINADLWYPAHLCLSPPFQSFNVACVPQPLLVKIFTWNVFIFLC